MSPPRFDTLSDYIAVEKRRCVELGRELKAALQRASEVAAEKDKGLCLIEVLHEAMEHGKKLVTEVLQSTTDIRRMEGWDV